MDIIVHPPRLLRFLLKKCIFNIPSEQKVLYITIDDGPIPEITPHTLELLKKYNAKATFFCVGDNVRKYPEIYQQILKEGHSVGNHTMNHLRGFHTKTQIYNNNVLLADKYISSNLFRPPHGRLRSSQAHFVFRQNKKIILWDVLSEDYNRKITPEQCFNNVLKFAKGGSIIVFHDNLKAKENQYYALEKTLEHYSNLGYKFLGIKF